MAGMCRAALIGLVGVACVSRSGTRSNRPDFTPVRAFIMDGMAKAHVPSMAVGVARGDTILWEEGFGFSDPARNAPATPGTMYYVASVTKLMTATALMELHERGQLDFDRPVNDYLGSEHISSPAWDPAEATVRRVATHMSGLATYDDDCSTSAPACQEQMIQRYGVLIWRPGERFDYSNLGYGVLSEVVRHVSRESYADFMRDSVFAPLGLTHCAVRVPPELTPLVAVPYDTRTGRVDHPGTRAAEGASGVYCSAHNLLRFAMFHLAARSPDQQAIIADSSIRALQAWTVQADDENRYGFGWWHDDELGYHVTYVGGGTTDAVALLYTIPSERIAVVVLANTYDRLASNTVEEILSTLLPAYRDARTRATPASEAGPPASGDSIPALHGTWTGAVRTDGGSRSLTLSIATSGSVGVVLAGKPPTPLEHAQYHNGELEGSFAGNLGVDDADRRRRYTLRLVLIRRSNNEFNGGVWTRPIPGLDNGPLHTYWVQVRR
jgi:CubicO group peptidase (beta-lactamase class C family)